MMIPWLSHYHPIIPCYFIHFWRAGEAPLPAVVDAAGAAAVSNATKAVALANVLAERQVERRLGDERWDPGLSISWNHVSWQWKKHTHLQMIFPLKPPFGKRTGKSSFWSGKAT